MWHLLRLTRFLDERLEVLYRQGKLPGSIYSGRGQEGTHIGTAFAMREGDIFLGTHRDLSASLARGLDLKRSVANFYGRVDGYTRGREGNSHQGDLRGAGVFPPISMLPDSYPVAIGMGISFKLRGEERVAVAMCGEGATATGTWHESLNWAGIHRLPVVFVCNNNQWAYSTPTNLEYPVEHVADRGPAYAMPGTVVDGADVLEVYATVREAVERARGGEGPSLIESVSLRWRGHAGHDPAKYVPTELLEDYRANRDPVKRFQDLLAKERVIGDDDIAEMDKRVKAEFDEAYEFAQSSPLPDPGEQRLGVFADDGFWDRVRAGGNGSGG